MKILERIKQKRKELGLRQSEVAKRIGKDQTGYSAIERGNRRMTLPELERICEALSLPFNLIDEGRPLEERVKDNEKAIKDLQEKLNK